MSFNLDCDRLHQLTGRAGTGRPAQMATSGSQCEGGVSGSGSAHSTAAVCRQISLPDAPPAVYIALLPQPPALCFTRLASKPSTQEWRPQLFAGRSKARVCSRQQRGTRRRPDQRGPAGDGGRRWWRPARSEVLRAAAWWAAAALDAANPARWTWWMRGSR